MNIIFIAVDALRASNLGCYGYKKNTSPNIDRLAKMGLLFEDTYACINHTDPSFTTIFSGRCPLSHGILNHGPRVTDIEVKSFNERGIKLLPEILKENDYRTLAIDWLWRWHKTGYDYYSGAKPQASLHGFLKQQVRKFPFLRRLITQSIIEKIQQKISKGISKPYEDAKCITDQAIKLISKNKQEKFFLFLHYWDTHTPYLPPHNYLPNYKDAAKKIAELSKLITGKRLKEKFSYFEKKVQEYQSTIIESYDGEISFADNEIGRLLNYLENQNLLNDTMIILTSDHGESLTEHGIYLDHAGLYDETLHVPFLLFHPDLPKDKRIKGFAQHYDFVPTILELLNIETDLRFDGKSAIPLIEGHKIHSAIYAEEIQYQRKRAIRNSNWKYIYSLNEKEIPCRRCGRIHGAKEELYDLNRDPKETENIMAKKPNVASDLRKSLETWINNLEYTEPKIDSSHIYKKDIDKVEERLKGLGYI